MQHSAMAYTTLTVFPPEAEIADFLVLVTEPNKWKHVPYLGARDENLITITEDEDNDTFDMTLLQHALWTRRSLQAAEVE